MTTAYIRHCTNAAALIKLHASVLLDQLVLYNWTLGTYPVPHYGPSLSLRMVRGEVNIDFMVRCRPCAELVSWPVVVIKKRYRADGCDETTYPSPTAVSVHSNNYTDDQGKS